MATDTIDMKESVARKPRRRWARGAGRPEYLRPADVDQLMIMQVALMTEVSALRDRIDTHEVLAARGIVATADVIDAFVLTPERRTWREEQRQAMLSRVLRVIFEEREAALDGARADELAKLADAK